MPNNWGFNESAPGGGGVRTDQVLKPKKDKEVTVEQLMQPSDHPVWSPGYPGDQKSSREQELDRLLFLKDWLLASMKDVEEAISKIQG